MKIFSLALFFALAASGPVQANTARPIFICNSPNPATLEGFGAIGMNFFVNLNSGAYQSLGISVSAGVPGNSAQFFVSGGSPFMLRALPAGQVELSTTENNRPLSLIFDRTLLAVGAQGSVTVNAEMPTVQGTREGRDASYLGTFTCRAQQDIGALSLLAIVQR